MCRYRLFYMIYWSVSIARLLIAPDEQCLMAIVHEEISNRKMSNADRVEAIFALKAMNYSMHAVFNCSHFLSISLSLFFSLAQVDKNDKLIISYNRQF